jgi:hypothetical protein
MLAVMLDLDDASDAEAEAEAEAAATAFPPSPPPLISLRSLVEDRDSGSASTADPLTDTAAGPRVDGAPAKANAPAASGAEQAQAQASEDTRRSLMSLISVSKVIVRRPLRETEGGTLSQPVWETEGGTLPPPVETRSTHFLADNKAKMEREEPEEGGPEKSSSSSSWMMYVCPRTRAPYYVNPGTGETTWTRPVGADGEPVPVETSGLALQRAQSAHHVSYSAVKQAAKSAPCTTQVDRLSSILDKIDGPRPKWIKIDDPMGRGSYYADAETGATQWEVPQDYNDLEEILTNNSGTGGEEQEQEERPVYSQAATFSTKSGRFDGLSGAGSHWERQGIPSDRESRQMSAYFDVSSLDENRKQALEKKRKLQQAKGINWKEIASERKKMKAKRKNAWLTDG